MIDLIFAGISAATAATGLIKSNNADKKAGKINKRVAAVQNKAADLELATSQKIAKITAQQEALRKQAMLVESSRQARQVAREVQLARATAVSGASESGGLTSTGLQGVLGSIQQQGSEQAQTIFENRRLGLKNFSLNAALTKVQSAANIKKTGYNKKLSSLGVSLQNSQVDSNFGKTLFNLGVQGMQSAGTFADVATSLFPKVK